MEKGCGLGWVKDQFKCLRKETREGGQRSMQGRKRLMKKHPIQLNLLEMAKQ